MMIFRVDIKYYKPSGFLKVRLLLYIMSVCLFPEVNSQVIHNNGASVSLNNGVFVSTKDLTTSGNILNNGNLKISGNFTGNGITGGNGFYKLGGNWINTGGTFQPGTSTVIFNGSLNQIITRTGGETFYNFSLLNAGLDSQNSIILSDNVNVTGILLMSTGIINTSGKLLFLTNPAASSLDYKSLTGSRVIGDFERAVNDTNSYLFPVGSSLHYNPANLKPHNINTPGSVLSRFVPLSPGNSGFPLWDPPMDIASAFQDGYWHFRANGFSTGDYNININASGFIDTVTSVSRVLIRTGGGDWRVDGVHQIADTVKSVVYRDHLVQGILSTGTDFAVGRPHPHILGHPRDTIVCENIDPVFRVIASGAATLKYKWYKKPGILISNGSHYDGARTATLKIIGAVMSDIGKYYCIVTDRYKNSTRSLDAYLTVNKIPVATITPESQPHECSNVTIAGILLGQSYGDQFTRYVWSRDNPAGIESSMPLTGAASIGDIIPGATFKNITDSYITITFTIIPVGPAPTSCTGLPVTATVTINPVPRATPLNNLPSLCYGGRTAIILKSPTSMTMGYIHFNYTVTKTAGASLVGNTASLNDLPADHLIGFDYYNNSDSLQSVHYLITPFNTSICPAGPVNDVDVKVHAKPLLDLPATIITLQSLTCEGGAGRAALRANISKGAAPYNITWTGPFGYTRTDSVDILKLSMTGKYVAKVTDNLGCSRKDSLNLVGVFAKPFIRAVPINPGGYNITCIGSTDGMIQVAVESGITPAYDYWVVKNNIDTLGRGTFSARRDPFNPGTFRNFTGLGPGEYSMIVSDVNRCVSTSTINFKVPPPFAVKFTASDYKGYNVSCKGYDDGFASAEVTGGRGFYKYRWYTNDGKIPTGMGSGKRIDNIPAGTYYLEVTDTLHCSDIFNLVISEPDGMKVTEYLLSESGDKKFNISCNGGSEGFIKMNVTGGIGNYFYEWTGPGGYTATTKDISGLKAGTYSCRVTSGTAGGCELMPRPVFTLTQPEPLNISYTTSHSVNGNFEINCNAGTGSIDVTVAGGSTGNYSYKWNTSDGSGISSDQADQLTLKAGTYNLLVTDLNGCKSTADITMKEPPLMSVQLTPTHINCSVPGFRNGAVDLTVEGGVAPYVYSWSNGSKTEDISSLTEGYYKVIVSYNNTCSKSDSVKINLPPPLSIEKQVGSLNGYEISCYGQADGKMSVKATSGKAPFRYSWTGPEGFISSSYDLTELKAGKYELIITDSNLCTAEDSIVLHEPGPLGMTFGLSSSNAGGFNVNCAGDSTGVVIVQPINAVGNVDYLWSDGYFGRTRLNLPAGTYPVVIRDGNGCQASGNAIVLQPDSLKFTFRVSKPFCPDMPDGSINPEVTGGVRGADYIYKWSDNSTGNTLAGITAGKYSLKIEDMNNCTVEKAIVIDPENPTCLGVPNIISPNGDLQNDFWNIENKELYPNMEVKIFNRRGRLLWKSDRGYGKAWDGKSNGDRLPIDSYHYIIDLHNGSKPVIGTITIVE